MSPQGRAQVVDLLERHGLRPRRALGQHFLADPNLTRKVVATAEVGPQSAVVEVGAGTGTLTAALAATGARVVAYEIDRSLRPALEETVGHLPNVELRFADVTELDLAAELEGSPWLLVANLPYNVGTPILLDVLRRVQSVRRMVVMVQREVADRLIAAPGSPAYGIPSVVVGLHGEARIAFRVPPQVFVPPPQVESAVVVVDRRTPDPKAEEAIRLAATGFGQRRKMLRRSLAELVPAEAFEAAGIPDTARPEELGPARWVRLAEVLDG